MKKIIIGVVAIAAILLLSSCTKKENTNASTNNSKPVVVKLGTVGTSDGWESAKESLKKQNIDLQFVEFSNYTTPNRALDAGEIDLNAFQHRIFLANEIENYNYNLKIVANSYILPLSLYSSKIKSVNEIKSGDKIAIPNDLTNGGRALKVLESAGLIVLSKDAKFSPTVHDIAENPSGIEIVELAANTIPSSLQDVTAAIVNGAYAHDFGLKMDEAIFMDTSLSQKEYWNIVVANANDLKNPEKVEVLKKVIAAYHTAETEKYYLDEYGGFYIMVGWDIDEFAN